MTKDELKAALLEIIDDALILALEQEFIVQEDKDEIAAKLDKILGKI